jgi:hypothetical protein
LLLDVLADDGGFSLNGLDTGGFAGSSASSWVLDTRAVALQVAAVRMATVYLVPEAAAVALPSVAPLVR